MADEGKKQSKEKKASQPDEGKKQPKERKVNLPEFIKKADPAELLALAQQTALVNHPLVRNFNDASASGVLPEGSGPSPAAVHRTEETRRLPQPGRLPDRAQGGCIGEPGGEGECGGAQGVGPGPDDPASPSPMRTDRPAHKELSRGGSGPPEKGG